jgi:hypothetical protein
MPMPADSAGLDARAAGYGVPLRGCLLTRDATPPINGVMTPPRHPAGELRCK